MIPWCHRVAEFRFSPDCPDHVKTRALNAIPDVVCGERTAIPLCDQRYVTYTDETISGWLFPFLGFVPDSRISRALTKLRLAVRGKPRIW